MEIEEDEKGIKLIMSNEKFSLSLEDVFAPAASVDDEAQTFDRAQINEMLLELGVRPSLRENV